MPSQPSLEMQLMEMLRVYEMRKKQEAMQPVGYDYVQGMPQAGLPELPQGPSFSMEGMKKLDAMIKGLLGG